MGPLTSSYDFRLADVYALPSEKIKKRAPAGVALAGWASARKPKGGRFDPPPGPQAGPHWGCVGKAVGPCLFLMHVSLLLSPSRPRFLKINK